MEADSGEAAMPPQEKKGRSRTTMILGAIALAVVLVLAIYFVTKGSGGVGEMLGTASASTAEFVFVGEKAGSVKPFYGIAGESIQVRAPAGDGAKYTWRWGDGSEVTSTDRAQTSHRYSDRGTYTVQLSVDGAKPVSREVRIVEAPKPAFDVERGGKGATLTGAGDNVVYIGDAVAFKGGRSTSDAEHRIVSYRWDFDLHNGRSVEAEGVDAAFAFTEPGGWTVRLTVVDDLGTTRYTDVFLTVGNIVLENGTVGTGIPPGTSQTFTDVHLDVDQSPKRGRAATHVEITVTWTPGQVPQASELNLTLIDAAQKVVGTAAKKGEEVKAVLVYDISPKDTRGVWTARLARDFPTDVLTTGVATEDVPYTLEARVVYQ